MLRVRLSSCRLTGCTGWTGRCAMWRSSSAGRIWASFRFSDLHHVVFADCNLTRADFQSADISGVQFRDCDLSGAQFSQATMQGTRSATASWPVSVG